ncbi:MAG: hypothetical protein FI707_04805 [SAR202 cluster bacterium]|jgi:hypothetical protein|nr:hypothetical protein [Chloroflexota bacterium]MDP6420219.1 hypothetical protein [SAR202 cluster bacterium]HAL48815.1 hypothetical protein [Dehalococcoidia bacterium]MDP6664936.1 hypothetical protein [SAR202 cluster bacterium]MDP6798690.1 hypothetical protein [SAR202 cluster bacterium]|tara:strand:+ start:270 stop:515 length:246 start_codon:yes stop_codon:yes gene_type:complete
MSKRMTVVFDDDELYTALKAEAARTGRYAKDIVTEALIEWFEAKEDEELSQGLDEIWAEYKRDGGIDAETFFTQLKAEAES